MTDVTDVPPKPADDPFGSPIPWPSVAYGPPPGDFTPPEGYSTPPQAGLPPREYQGFGPPPGYGVPTDVPGNLADWPQRAGGYLIDHGPPFVVNLVGGGLPTALRLVVGVAVLSWVIFLAVQLGRSGSTPGMRVMGLQAVSKMTGRPIGGSMGVVRAVAHVTDTVACLVGWLFPLWDRQRQTLADKIVGTVVVRVAKQGYSVTPPAQSGISRHRRTVSTPTTGTDQPPAQPVAGRRRWGVLVAAVVFFAALVAVAVSTNKNRTAAPINTVTPYIAKDASFSAVFPTRPKESHTKIVKNGQTLDGLQYLAGDNDESIGVVYLVVPEVDSVSLDGWVDGEAAATRGRIVSRTTTTYLGYPAEDAVITVGLGVIHSRVFALGQAVYGFLDVSTSTSGPYPVYDRLLATFHLLGAASALQANLGGPDGLAVAADGSVYIADYSNNRIRVVTASGSITTVAGGNQGGFFGDGGAATAAELSRPRSVALAGDGSVYIADYGNDRVRRISPAGIIATVAGNGRAGFSGDGGPGVAARMDGPDGVAVAPDGSVYIADQGNNRVRRVSPAGVITTVAGDGMGGFSGDNGPAAGAELNGPEGVAVARDGSIYIADSGNDRVRLVNPAGVITTVAGDGQDKVTAASGLATAAELTHPNAVAVAGDGTLYISDYGDEQVRRVSPVGIMMTVAGFKGVGGFSGDGGLATYAKLAGPTGVAVAGDGSVYIADHFNNQVRRVSPAGIISTVAGDGQGGFGGDGGPATAAELTHPTGVAVAGDGSIYLVDQGNNRVRRVSPAGIISTVAGDGQAGFSGDGGPAIAAELSSPYAVAVGPDGSVYIADFGNYRVRRVSLAGVISTVAGDGQVGFSGDGKLNGDGGLATAAQIGGPTGLAVAGDGSVYVGEAGNNTVRRVSPAGSITTVAGDGNNGFSGDGGPATTAELSDPASLAVAGDGSIYIADKDNNRVRRVSPGGIITTVAGDGKNGFSGDGGPATAAELSGADGVAVAGDGSVYVADDGNNRVRRVSPDGIIFTIAGSGAFISDGGPATAAELSGADGVAVAANGRVYVADYGNNRVRSIGTDGIIATVAGISSRP